MTESPEQAIAENEATWKLYERRLGKILDRMGRYVQLITMGDDLGMQSGPLCRPAVLEQCVMPFVRRFCDFVHRHSDVKVFLHCCGSIRSILPMLIDAGIDVINPVQISAHDMDPATLKREFGEKIIFWGGGCDTQNILTTGTPDDVRRNVTHLASIFNQGGGFVFNPVHNILGDVPPQNIVALFDTAYAVSG
jgi:uroporphyrinogen decarboxylase